MTAKPRPSIVSFCLDLLERLALLSDKASKAFRGASKTYKDFAAAGKNLRDVCQLVAQLREAVVAFFRPDGGTAEAC
ncbi:hypothetical protein AB0L71_28195 [Streptomyces sp. NPDC052052]|uniref:hypothetical protein n=1 Tax=Streptomyces sp. NPDC052052 TaxID=3154756 RepID=UPI00342FDF4D